MSSTCITLLGLHNVSTRLSASFHWGHHFTVFTQLTCLHISFKGLSVQTDSKSPEKHQAYNEQRMETMQVLKEQVRTIKLSYGKP